MTKAELLAQIDALRAEVEKKPEDKIIEKLDEILRAIQAQGLVHFHVCPPCTRPHYPTTYYPPVITWGNTATASGSLSTTPSTGTVWLSNDAPNLHFTEN